MPSFKLPNQRFLFLIGAVLVGFALVFILSRSFMTQGAKNVPQEKKVEAQAPKPVPLPEPKPGDYPVRVLNGTLVSGEAGKLADALKVQGFVVTETKNATNSAFLVTKLRLAADVPEKIATLVESSLTTTYETVLRETLSDPTVKVEVIIGRKK